MPITEDLQKSSANDGPEGLEIDRVFHVDGLGGGRPDSYFTRALDRLSIPIGSPHPSAPRLVAVNRSVRVIDASQCEITVTYRIPRVDRGESPPSSIDDSSDPGTIRVGASETTVRKTTDITGETMIVTHLIEVEKEDDFGDDIKVLENVDVTVEAEVPVPQVVLQIERIEFGEPGPKARRFVGRVNSAAVGSDGPRTWLCTRIDGTSTDGGRQYRVVYEFQFAPETWDFEAVWRDPETGEIPTDLVPGKGRKTFKVIGEANFSELRLGFLGDR